MTSYIIEIEVYYESGKTPKKAIDLTKVLTERNINPNNFTSSYNTTPSSGVPVSGGYISHDKEKVTLKDNTVIETPVSLNVRARFDKPENLWNVDVYVDRHDYSLSEADRKIINRRESRIHKESLNNVGNSEKIKVLWWINGISQTPVEGIK